MKISKRWTERCLQTGWSINEPQRLYPKKRKSHQVSTGLASEASFSNSKVLVITLNSFHWSCWNIHPNGTLATLSWVCTFFSPYSFLTFFLALECISRYHWENPTPLFKSNLNVSLWVTPARSNPCLFCTSKICAFLPFNHSSSCKYLLSTKYVPGSFIHGLMLYIYILKDFIYLFLDRGERKERGRETSMCGCPSRVPYWGPGPQLGMCPDWESSWWHFGS